MTERPPSPTKPEPKYWLDQPGNVNKIVYTLYTVCALLFLFDLCYHKHTSFAFEDWFGFFGWYGFASCMGLVLGARGLRMLLKRREDYYDR